MSYKATCFLICSSLALLVQPAIVNFQLDLTWGWGAPDGTSRQMVLMNGAFPGPQLNVEYGDQVQVIFSCTIIVFLLTLS
jgi:FtsP/CotA-like multicopper oxidase with cupredoxin domain